MPFSLTAKLAEQGKAVIGLEGVVEKPPPPPPGQAPPFVKPVEVTAKPNGQAPPFEPGGGKQVDAAPAAKSSIETLDKYVESLREVAASMPKAELRQKFDDAADRVLKLKDVLTALESEDIWRVKAPK